MTGLGYGRYLIHLIRSALLGPNKGPFTSITSRHLKTRTPDLLCVLQLRR